MKGLKIRDQPFYLQSTVVLFGVMGLIYAFWILADVMIPLAFSVFISILLNPLCKLASAPGRAAGFYRS